LNTFLEKRSPALLVILSCFVALGPLSTDMYLPAFPTLLEAFDVDSTLVQLTLSAYLIGFCVFHLVCGPLSDRYGRKPILLLGMLIFLGASIVCALATSIEQLIMWRFIQGIGACSGPTLARAMVRDMYGPIKAVNALAYMGAIMALAPVVAPIIGGWMLTFISWRYIFLFLCVYCVICIGLLFWRVPESLPEKQSILFSSVFRNYWLLLKNRQFCLNVLIASLLYSGTFAFVSSSSFILIDFMGVPANQFGYWFMFIVVGYIFGNVITGRYAQKIPQRQLITWGASMAVIASLIMTLLCLMRVYHPLAIVLPVALYTCSVGMTLPQAMTEAMASFSKIAGTASALMGFIQMATASLVTVVTSAVLTGEPMPLAMTLMGCAGTTCVLILLLFKQQPAGS
jgi:MFS transporter, DHA1 family, multidrug resistance protein